MISKARDLFEKIVNGTLKGVGVIGLVAAILLAIAIVLGMVAYCVMGLWNNVIPDVTGFKALTFWQAYALLLLCWILSGARK